MLLHILLNFFLSLFVFCEGQAVNKYFPDEDRKQTKRNLRLEKFVHSIKTSSPKDFKPVSWSKSHRAYQKYVIFAVALEPLKLGHSFNSANIRNFLGTARTVGFTGDIVTGISPNMTDEYLDFFKLSQSVVYEIPVECKGSKREKMCILNSVPDMPLVSINMLRFYIYQWWSKKYSTDTIIMLSDIRDVQFQSNPFTYRLFEWAPPASQLVFFKEAHPNAVINRCAYNSGWIKSCYGKNALDRVGFNTVICSGITIGTRDAITAYTFMMTQQLNPKVRMISSNNSELQVNKGCISNGMDQGFHNWLYYSGQLDKYVNVRVFEQGEGPINTVGSLKGSRKILQWNLEKWGILMGTPPQSYISNWNGERSPVIHQLDRFMDAPPFNGSFKSILGCVQDIKWRPVY